MSATTQLRVLPAMLVTFPTGLPGFPGVRQFHLAPIGQENLPNPFGRLSTLEAVHLADGHTVGPVALNVAATGLLWPDLVVEIDDNAEAVLELDRPEDAAVLAVVTLRRPVERSTANLFAPIVLNVRRGLGLQFVPQASEITVGRLIHSPLPLPLSS